MPSLSHSRKLLFLSLVCLLCLLVAELTLRAIGFQAHSEVTPSSVGRFDSDLGWSLQPGAIAVSHRLGYAIEYRINSRGLRDKELPYKKPPNERRIALIGDSNTFGFGVPIEKHFSVLLEGYFPDLEIVNLGVGGFGVDQELLRLRTEGFRYEPDWVMAFIDGEYPDDRHIHEIRFGRRKPRFIWAGNGELELIGAPVTEVTYALQSNPLRDLHRRLRELSALYEAVRQAWSARRSAALPAATDAAAGEKPPDDRAEIVALGDAIVLQIRRETEARGARFLLVTPTPRLHQVALENGIESIDVSQAAANSHFSLPDGLQHYNESGNGALAWEIARQLRERALLAR